MTVVTGIAARDVVLVFPGGRNAVMTGTAGADDLRVVDRNDRCEHIGCVAVLADVSRLDVRLVLAGCFGAVMAADAVVGDIRMIEIRRQPGGRRMTVVTGVVALDMCRVLAGGAAAVMTGAAGADDLRVVDRKDRCKDIGCVAVLTNIGSEYVLRAFTSGFAAIVAVDAVTGNIYMVEIRRQPRDRRVTIVAVNTAGNMRRVLSSGRDAVMTGAAGAQHLRVIYACRRRPGDFAMTVFADVCRLYVARNLAGSIRTIMAADAVIKDIGVIEYGRQPARRCVTVIALITRRDMSRCLPGRLDAIVTTDTTTGYGRVIHESNHAPARSNVTVGAFTRRRNMAGRF